MGKNEAQISGFTVVKKASSSSKNSFSKKKKFIPPYFCRYDLPNGVQKFLQNKWVLKYLSFGDFKVLKIVLHHKIINKNRSTKSQENSAHHFVDNYLTNHIAKFLQDRIKPWRVYLNKHFISEQDFVLIGIHSNQD